VRWYLRTAECGGIGAHFDVDPTLPREPHSTCAHSRWRLATRSDPSGRPKQSEPATADHLGDPSDLLGCLWDAGALELHTQIRLDVRPRLALAASPYPVHDGPTAARFDARGEGLTGRAILGCVHGDTVNRVDLRGENAKTRLPRRPHIVTHSARSETVRVSTDRTFAGNGYRLPLHPDDG
jgi:hypothetical protein